MAAEEEALAEIFAELLDLENVDGDVSFLRYEDSLGVLKLVSRARARGLLITVADVFECRTWSALAIRAREAAAEESDEADAGSVSKGGTSLVVLDDGELEELGDFSEP